MSFGKRLRELREECKLTQAQAAVRCQVPSASWSHWEAGKRNPSMASLRNIGTGLSFDADIIGWLVMGEEEFPTSYSMDVRMALRRMQSELNGLLDIGRVEGEQG